MNSRDIIRQLKSQANPKNVAGMARFGINGKNVLGISIPYLRNLAKEIMKTNTDNHKLAGELWSSKIHEARILASFIDSPENVTEKQMETWVKDFDSWDLCDQVTTGLFDRTTFAYKKAFEWSKRCEEFVKRAGFALMAGLAVHNKKADDKAMIEFFEPIIRESTDERNFVRKAINWALRNIGKRNQTLKDGAIKTAQKILRKAQDDKKNQGMNNKTARWIASDAIRELEAR